MTNNLVSKAIVVRESTQGKFEAKLETKSFGPIKEGEVLIEVKYSSLNYKDALSMAGNKGVTRNYPHTPGIDAAGMVLESKSLKFKAQEKVLVTGYDLGMNTSGGLAQHIVVPDNWIVRLPEKLTFRSAMALGTAGFTAGICVERIINHPYPNESRDVLVTGSTGGVGSIAVAILAQLGFEVTAVTGKKDKEKFLIDLGAKQVIDRASAIQESNKPLLSGKWFAVVDTVGGKMLSTAISSTRPYGVVTCCGLVSSPDFFTTVFPFIIRGVSLMGVASADYPMEMRQKIWDRLAVEWFPSSLDLLTTEIELEQVVNRIDDFFQGKALGRIVVKI